MNGGARTQLLELFNVYTGTPDSIGALLTKSTARARAADPLVVATASEIVLYPGGGRPPELEGYRLSTRGFKELTAVSHLGPALASVVMLKEMRKPWRGVAERLLEAARAARTASTIELWRDQIAVSAYVGREEAIAKMSRYACTVSERFLERALANPAYAAAASLRANVLDGPSPDLPVPLNRVMVATFFLVGMDIAHRIIRWFDRLDLPWERTMVLVAGQAGRPTAGATVESNSVAGVIEAASRGRLPNEHLFVAPHAPALAGGEDRIREAAALETRYRHIYAAVEATIDLGGVMFDGYPRFKRLDRQPGPAVPGIVSQKPRISSPDDWFGLITRLRFVLEDPRQMLSGAVTDYASDQLVSNGNDPRCLVVPGLDGEAY